MNEWQGEVESGRFPAYDESPEPLTFEEAMSILGAKASEFAEKFKTALIATGRQAGKAAAAQRFSNHMSGVTIDIQVTDEIRRFLANKPPPVPIVPIAPASCRVSSVPVGSTCSTATSPGSKRQGPFAIRVGPQGYHPRWVTLAEQTTGIRSTK